MHAKKVRAKIQFELRSKLRVWISHTGWSARAIHFPISNRSFRLHCWTIKFERWDKIHVKITRPRRYVATELSEFLHCEHTRWMIDDVMWKSMSLLLSSIVCAQHSVSSAEHFLSHFRARDDKAWQQQEKKNTTKDDKDEDEAYRFAIMWTLVKGNRFLRRAASKIEWMDWNLNIFSFDDWSCSVCRTVPHEQLRRYLIF